MSRKNCVYCNKEIIKRSKEHVIHNALGGLYESTDVCCDKCNNIVSQKLNKPFTTIFNPIIGQIDNFSKTNNTKSVPPCTGFVEYQGKEYKAFIKNGKVVGCPELSREIKDDATKLPLKIVRYEFDVNNEAFGNGFSKIAFNYALDKGIDFNLIKHGLDIKTGPNGINDIKFNYPIVPFCPLNPVDFQLEFQPVTLYHTMILYNQGGNLWCYIDLFNTFQFYVLMSDKMPKFKKIHYTYAQTVQKLDRTVPDLDIGRQKDILIYAKEYGVEPCNDIDEFTKRIRNAINQQSQKMPLSDLISPRLQHVSPLGFGAPKNFHELMLMHDSLNLYLDQDTGKMNKTAFRTTTIGPGDNLYSYPHAIAETQRKNPAIITQYTHAKFERLNAYLCDNTK